MSSQDKELVDLLCDHDLHVHYAQDGEILPISFWAGRWYIMHEEKIVYVGNKPTLNIVKGVISRGMKWSPLVSQEYIKKLQVAGL